jgi:hypothetical protein
MKYVGWSIKRSRMLCLSVKNIYHSHSFVERYVKVTCLLSMSLAVCLETKITGRRFRIDKRNSTLYMMYL